MKQSESTNNESIKKHRESTKSSKNGEETVSRQEEESVQYVQYVQYVQFAVFCPPSHQTCGQGDTNAFE